MVILNHEACMLQLLRLAADGQVHRFSEAVDTLADQFSLSAEERRELLPSGKATRIYSRVQWACVYLVQAGLLARPKRGYFTITDRGREVLNQDPPELTADYLMRFEEFRDFKNRRSPDTPSEAIAPSREQTPDEVLESAYEQMRADLAKELLVQVQSCSPRFFERLVVDLLVAMGYGGSRVDAGQAIGQSGDGGVDGIIKEDKLGLDVVYIQAKRWEAPVGRPAVQAFAGSLEGLRARKGVLITTSGFTRDARDYVERIEKKIVLIDGERLAKLMMDHGQGVNETARYVIQRIDSDYFEEG